MRIICELQKRPYGTNCREKTEFTLGEALKTCALMPEYKMDYVFAMEEKVA